MKTVSTLLGLFALSALSASAQPAWGPEGKPFERIDQWRKVRMIEMLDLSEDQSARFVARLNEHEKEKRELMRAKGEILDRLERLVRMEAEEKEYEKLFGEVREINTNITDHQLKFFNSLKDILSPEQRAKLLLFERQFERQLREAMREVQRRRHGSP